MKTKETSWTLPSGAGTAANEKKDTGASASAADKTSTSAAAAAASAAAEVATKAVDSSSSTASATANVTATTEKATTETHVEEVEKAAQDVQVEKAEKKDFSGLKGFRAKAAARKKEADAQDKTSKKPLTSDDVSVASTTLGEAPVFKFTPLDAGRYVPSKTNQYHPKWKD